MRRPKRITWTIRRQTLPYIERKAMTGGSTALTAAIDVVDNDKTGLISYYWVAVISHPIMFLFSGGTIS